MLPRNKCYRMHFYGIRDQITFRKYSGWRKSTVNILLHGEPLPCGPGLLHHQGSPSPSFRSTTLGTTPLGEWSAGSRDLYLTTYNTHKRGTAIPLTGFEPAFPTSEKPQSHALDRPVISIGAINLLTPSGYFTYHQV